MVNNLTGLDLRALTVFEAVLEERSTTRAGHRLAMSQPAVSSAINRLRRAAGDELFVRGRSGMRPTPRALELAPAVADALGRLRDAFEPASFDPATSHRTFTLAMADHAAALFLPGLASRLRAAPHIDIRVLPNWNVNAPELLDQGRIDFAIGYFSRPPPRLDALPLVEDEYVVAFRSDHPLARGRLMLARYLAADHLLVSLSGEPTGLVDRKLDELGHTRRVTMTVNQFAVVPRVLCESDLIVTIVRRAVSLSALALQIAIRAVPFDLPSSALSLLWHRRLGEHPANHWLRQVLSEIAASRSG